MQNTIVLIYKQVGGGRTKIGHPMAVVFTVIKLQLGKVLQV